MARFKATDYEGDVRVEYTVEDDGIGIRYSQDIDNTLDKIAASNADGGIKAHEGIGRPKYEVPVTIAMDYCTKRGIPWEKFLYSNEYDAEWPKLAAEYTKLVYQHRKAFV